jgi:Tfp pilus assembly protein PilF
MSYARLLSIMGVALLFTMAACGPTMKERQSQAETQYEIGIAELASGRLNEAFESIQNAIEIYPEDPRFFNGMGLVYFYQRRYDKAVREFQYALELDQNYADAHNNLGSTYAQMQKWDEAIVEFRQAISDPFYRTPELAYYHLGVALMEKGDLLEAVKELHTAVQLRPDFSQALDKYGVVLFRLNRIQESVKQFKQAIEIDPTYVEPYLNLGLAYMKQGKRDEAITQFKFVKENSRDESLVNSAQRYLEILE